MNTDYGKFREKIPGTPALIPNIFIKEANIKGELETIFRKENPFTEEQIQKLKSYSLSLRDFLTNISTILLFVRINDITIEEALNKQYNEEKETLGNAVFKFLLEKNVSELSRDEKKKTIDFGLGINDKNGEFHLHPLVAEAKKSP